MKSMIPRWLILAQSVSSGGYGKISNHSMVLEHLKQDRPFRRFFERETNEIPDFFILKVKHDLGPLFWSWLPGGALEHDPNACFKNASG